MEGKESLASCRKPPSFSLAIYEVFCAMFQPTMFCVGSKFWRLSCTLIGFYAKTDLAVIEVGSPFLS